MDSVQRLIEQWMPINQVSTEAIRERNAASALPPVNWLHVWWARRPLVASRAATLLSMLPAEYDSPKTREKVIEILGTSPDIHKIGERISVAKASGKKGKEGYKGHKRAFEHNLTEEEFQWLEEKLTEPNTVILDVTAGGGSIPFEAGRLGFRTIANELNPVAYLILRATCEWPQQFGQDLLKDYQVVSDKLLDGVKERLAHIYPEQAQPDCANGRCPHPQRYRCTEGCKEPHSCNHTKIGSKEHSSVNSKRHVWAYLWTRTAECQACGSEIPLSPNWKLDSKATGICLKPNGQMSEFKIVHDQKNCPDCQNKNPQNPVTPPPFIPTGKLAQVQNPERWLSVLTQIVGVQQEKGT